MYQFDNYNYVSIQKDAEKLSYADGLKLSRSFHFRNKYQTLLLQEFIHKAVKTVQDTSVPEEECKKALDFLVKAYEPFILLVARTILSEMSFPDEYADMKQYVYEAFILLVYRYNQSCSSFSYYIKKFLKMYTKEYIKKFLSYYGPSEIVVDSITISLMQSPFQHMNSESIHNISIGNILQQEYVKFIVQRANISSRRNTIREVCYRFFLGNDSCSQISQDLGITYTAVYQIIIKIKSELAEYLSNSPYCSYIIDFKQKKLYEKAV